MDRTSFCRDPFLRTSAYNMATWAVVNVLFSVPNYALAAGAAWSPGLLGTYSLVLFASGVALSAVHERRVGKLVGPAGQALFPAGKLWGPLLLIGVVGTVSLIVTSRPQFIQPLWLLVVGSAYVIWGVATSFRLYQLLGGVLGVAGLVVLALQETRPGAVPSVLGLHLWNLTMGGFSFAVAVATNRRYLWIAPAGGRRRD
ncbi:MAG: hypothetical protein HY899_12215 [Deltaproteobacteria bacterium]|nr:hypothetical protein [Deltaproteobacteria bacterium]